MLQIVIVSLYVAVTIAIGIWTKRKTDSSRTFNGAELGLLLCVVAGLENGLEEPQRQVWLSMGMNMACQAHGIRSPMEWEFVFWRYASPNYFAAWG